jgi:threonine dehydrogenase-like Zn-dependent dehydrogenase
MIRGTMPGMVPGTILGHEGVGVVEDVGPNVRNLKRGDRVVIGSTIACGRCAYCLSGYYAQCDVANPHGVLTQREPIRSAIDAYKAFDTRQPGWIKVELTPATSVSAQTKPRRTAA